MKMNSCGYVLECSRLRHRNRPRRSCWESVRNVLYSVLVIVASVVASVILAIGICTLFDSNPAPRYASRETVPKGREIKTGPRGGKYYETGSGRKVYLPRSRYETTGNENQEEN